MNYIAEAANPNLIISANTHYLLPQAYQNAVTKLSILLSKTSDIKVQRELFESFAKKFTLHPEILRAWKKLETRGIHLWEIEKLEERETYVNIIASDHLIDDTFLNFSFSKPNQFPVLNKVLIIYRFNETFLEHDADRFLDLIKNIKEALTFPNPHLKLFWNFYQKHSLNKITDDLETNYNQAKILWNKIVNVDRNTQKWIECLKKTHDHEYVIQNLEAQLGRNPFNKTVWNGYINYLKYVDPKFMLNVYSRYCHFFVDDWEMRENYYREIKRLQRKGEDVFHWIDDYKTLKLDFRLVIPGKYLFNRFLNNLCDIFMESIENCFKSFKTEQRIYKQLPITVVVEPFTSEFIPYQTTTPSFRLPIFEYIAKNANKKLITKLCSISKWFGYRILLCHRLSITDSRNTRVSEASILFSQNNSNSNSNSNHSKLKNIFVTNALIVTSNYNLFALSKIMHKLIRCDPLFIDIQNQIITYNEYCFITADGNVVDFCFNYVSVLNENGEGIPVDYLIEKIPYAKFIKFGPGTIIDRSSRLGDFKSKTIIKKFELHGLDETFDVFGFSLFIKGNTLPNTNLSLHYKDDVEATVKADFRCQLFFITESWIPRFVTHNLNIV